MGRKRKSEQDQLPPKPPEPPPDERDERDYEDEDEDQGEEEDEEREQEQAAPKVSEAIRQALLAMGVDTSTKEVEDWITARYDMDLPRGFPSAVSAQRKKIRLEQGSRQGRPNGSEATTVKDLIRVKELSAEFGGVERMAEQVKEVEEAAEEVGGLEKLRRCLEALQELSQQ